MLDAVLGLGASLGGRRANLALAVRLLDADPRSRVTRTSRILETAAVGGVARGPFLNAAVRVDFRGSVGELLGLCQDVERRLGRQRAPRWADRAIDVDVLWIAGRRVRLPELQVPHPRLQDRPFALGPLRDVAPGARCAHSGRSLFADTRQEVVPHAVGVLAGPVAGVYRGLPSRTPLRAGGAMKFFLDTANLDQVREIAAWGILDGVTTNPSLIAKEGGDFVETVAEICTIVNGPVSAEVVAENPDDMVTQGRLLARISDHVVVKVPLTVAGITATARLSAEGIRTNVTLCFQANQALIAAKAGATYISPFIGRVDDISTEGMQLIEEIVSIYANFPELDTQVLAASIRHPLHVSQSALAGADVATIPYPVMKKLLNHPLTDSGNTKFTADWASVPDSDIVGQVQRYLDKTGR